MKAAFAACCVLVLSGCPVVDLGDDPPDIGRCSPKKGFAYFESDIWPKYLAPTDMSKSCVRSGGMCHVNARGVTLDPMATDLTGNYRVVQGYLNCGSPTSSFLLTKPLANIDPHGGGDLFPSMTDPAVVTFLEWFK